MDGALERVTSWSPSHGLTHKRAERRAMSCRADEDEKPWHTKIGHASYVDGRCPRCGVRTPRTQFFFQQILNTYLVQILNTYLFIIYLHKLISWGHQRTKIRRFLLTEFTSKNTRGPLNCPADFPHFMLHCSLPFLVTQIGRP